MDKLSDFQLYALTINRDLRYDLKDQALMEFKARGILPARIDQLALEYEEIIPVINSGYTVWEKVGIMAFPFIIPLQAILANRQISAGNPKKWKQHWKFVTIGLLIWLIVFIPLLFLLKY